MPCTTAITAVGSLFCMGIVRVNTTARNPRMAKTRYGVRKAGRCSQTKPRDRVNGMTVETITTTGASSTSKPRMISNSPATSSTPKAMV